MKRLTPDIHGIRIYPNTLKLEPGEGGSPILIHGQISKRYNDLSYLFLPVSEIWKNVYMARDFGTQYDESGRMADPIPELKTRYGSALVQAYVKPQIAILNGNAFSAWSLEENIYEGAFIPIFSEMPDEKMVSKLFWDNEFKLTSRTWPTELLSFIHMWDDVFWQYFSRDKSEIDLLIEEHLKRKKMRMFHVDLNREYPDPSADELKEITNDQH
jgi:hypothetical protein